MQEIKFGDMIIYPEVITDEFSGTKKILIKEQGMPGDYFIELWGDDNINLQFGFRNISGNDYIVFRCWKSMYKLKQGDTIYFLFEGGDIIEFLLVSKSYNVPNDQLGNIENPYQITIPELDILSGKKLIKWKIKSCKNNLEIMSGFSKYLELSNFQKLIMEVVQAYKGAVQQYVDNYSPLYERTFQSQNEVEEIKNTRERIPQDVMDAVWRRDEGKCVKCGSKENLEFDHIIPVSKGGANTYRNIQLLCEKCNREKSNKIG